MRIFATISERIMIFRKKAFIFLTYWGSVTTIGKAHESTRRVTLYFVSFIEISGDFIHFLPTN